MRWPLHKAGELFHIQLGKMLSEKARVGAQLPYLANFNVRWGRFDLSTLNQMAFSDTERERFSIQRNDLLMCEGGEIGRCAVWTDQGSTLFFQKALHRLRPHDERTNTYFMYFFMQYIATRGDLPKLVGETSIAHLTREKLMELPVPLPPRLVQDAIVEALLAWDLAIQKTQELISAKERHFSATSHMLLTGRKRINGFSRPWELRRAVELFENRSSKGHGDEPLLSVTQERGVIPRDMLEGRVTMPSGETASYRLVEPGNFVISLRSFQGGVEHSDYRGVVSPAYTVLRRISPLDERFFRHYFKSADFIKRLSVAVIGIRDGKQISFRDFCSIKLPFPQVNEQNAIAAVLDEAEGEIRLLLEYRDALKTQKRGLMQKLLTGQWRLPLSKEEIV